jgi:Putative citrate transport
LKWLQDRLPASKAQIAVIKILSSSSRISGETVRASIISRRWLAAAASAIFAAALGCGSAFASTSDAAIDGSKLSLLWVLPFGGILGSLALFPILVPHFWHRFYGLVALF